MLRAGHRSFQRRVKEFAPPVQHVQKVSRCAPQKMYAETFKMYAEPFTYRSYSNLKGTYIKIPNGSEALPRLPSMLFMAAAKVCQMFLASFFHRRPPVEAMRRPYVPPPLHRSKTFGMPRCWLSILGANAIRPPRPQVLVEPRCPQACHWRIPPGLDSSGMNCE